jgi:hypothetical protein
MLLHQKSYLCKKLSMLYDSNGLMPYIYVLFFKSCPCATHTHTYIYSIGLTPKSVEYQFFGLVSEVFGTAEAVFTGHVRPMDRTYPASRTCPAPGPYMFESRVSSLYKGAERPLMTLGLFVLFHSISCGGQGLSRRFWVFSTKSLRFLGDLTPLLLMILKP